MQVAHGYVYVFLVGRFPYRAHSSESDTSGLGSVRAWGPPHLWRVDDTKPFGVMTNAQWGALEPLIEVVRPRGKTEPQELRRTVEAIIWRHDNGAKWRAIPAELGPRWMAAQCFNRWFHLGVWERLLAVRCGP